MMTEAEDEDLLLTHALESRDHGPQRMRFPVDRETTERLKNLHLDIDNPIPRWRRLLRWLRGESY